MKLAWMAEDIASARRATSFLVALLVGSMLVNLVLAVFAARLSGHERIVIVPPNIHKTFWVESDRVSSEYLEQMGYFLMQLTLNVTPQSVDHQAKLLLQYAAPASFGELRTALLAAAERLKRDGASTVSEVSKAYAIELQYAGGRMFLKAFRETNPNDPLELQSKPVPAAIAAGTQ